MALQLADRAGPGPDLGGRIQRRLQDQGLEGGYYDYGQTVVPLRNGAASFVIYANGTATVGEWGQDAVMGPDIAAVRQNLTLLVDNGGPCRD